MSIAAIIDQVSKTPKGLKLTLRGKPYQQHNGHTVTPHPGQPALTILEPTWTPAPGTEIWGGSDNIIIEATPPRHYDRVGYTHLRERPKQVH